MNEIYADVTEDYSVDGPNFQWVVLASEVEEREAALREELDKANDKIDKAWNLSHALDHQGFIPGALDAWKRPVKQHLPYDFSGNPGASATQYCNGWNDSGGYWSAHAKDIQQRLTLAEQFVQKLIDCTKNQDSIATGYLSDILDVIKGENV